MSGTAQRVDVAGCAGSARLGVIYALFCFIRTETITANTCRSRGYARNISNYPANIESTIYLHIGNYKNKSYVYSSFIIHTRNITYLLIHFPFLCQLVL